MIWCLLLFMFNPSLSIPFHQNMLIANNAEKNWPPAGKARALAFAPRGKIMQIYRKIVHFFRAPLLTIYTIWFVLSNNPLIDQHIYLRYTLMLFPKSKFPFAFSLRIINPPPALSHLSFSTPNVSRAHRINIRFEFDSKYNMPDFTRRIVSISRLRFGI